MDFFLFYFWGGGGGVANTVCLYIFVHLVCLLLLVGFGAGVFY